ncbi:MAG: thymidylate synthase [Nanoarchaeota archaeon]
MVEQYLEHSKDILTSDYSGFKGGSKEAGLISLFGYQNEYDLRDGFPLLTTKKMSIDPIVHELIWFLKGDTNIKYLEDHKVSIWRADAFQHNLSGMIKEGIFSEGMKKYSHDWNEAMKEYGQRIREDEEFAGRFGDAGPIYGRQWRKWKYTDKNGKTSEIDQLGRVLDNMRKKPVGKKHLINAWNPGDVPKMSLPPCHVLYQMTANEEGQLDLQLYQRSCDMFLGVPFNIASYSMLTQIIAQELDLEPRRFIHTFGDSHFYSGLEKRSAWYRENLSELKNRVRNVSDREGHLGVLDWINTNSPREQIEEEYDHVTAILEQLSREPKALPRLQIARKDFDKLTIGDFKIEGYEPHSVIKRKMAV